MWYDLIGIFCSSICYNLLSKLFWKQWKAGKFTILPQELHSQPFIPMNFMICKIPFSLVKLKSKILTTTPWLDWSKLVKIWNSLKKKIPLVWILSILPFISLKSHNQMSKLTLASTFLDRGKNRQCIPKVRVKSQKKNPTKGLKKDKWKIKAFSRLKLRRIFIKSSKKMSICPKPSVGISWTTITTSKEPYFKMSVCSSSNLQLSLKTEKLGCAAARKTRLSYEIWNVISG